ncbi:MAG TPA: amino acid ABC transporter permease [Nitriliruptoraceae bacterium]|nr:amino acid ABC transporter permease [Nitriliruptoraceae bacterium]
MSGLLLNPSQYQRLLEGAWFTVQILGYSFVLGVFLSLVFGVLRLSDNRIVRGIALTYTEFARGISSIVLLFIMAYAVPILMGLPQANLTLLASIALGLNMGGYGAEIIRGGILSVPRGQTEASIALNLTNNQRLRHIILPQAMRVILPPMGNLTIEILKGTALVSLIGLVDLTGAEALAFNGQAAPTFEGVRHSRAVFDLNVLVMYFVIAQAINLLFRRFEARIDARFESRKGEIAPVEDAIGASK